MLSENVQFLGTHHSLMKVLQDELQWIELQQYTKDPHYVALLEAIQNLSQLDSSLTDIAKDLLSKLYELSYNIEYEELLIDVCLMEVHSMEEKALQIENQLHKQRDRAEGLEEIKQSQQKRLAEWEHEYETMKAEYGEVVANLEEEKKRARRERKQVKRTFLQVKEDNEYDRILLQNLQEEKMSIAEKMESQKKNNEALMEEVKLLKQKISETERHINSSATKLSYEEKRAQKLEEELAQKDRLIAILRQQEHTSRVQQQLENIDIKELMENIEEDKHREENVSSQITKKVSFVGTFNLADEIDKEEQFEPSFQRNNSATLSVKNSMKSAASHEEAIINGSIIEEEFQPSESRADMQNSRKAAVPDFYFAHYLLTVQSMKLKLSQEELFPIDMGTYYSEMIGRGTPFHQWDEWIKEKLVDLSKKKS